MWGCLCLFSSSSQNQSGVLGWLSNGFVNALPQPAGSPRLTRANADAKVSLDGEWIYYINNNVCT